MGPLKPACRADGDSGNLAASPPMPAEISMGTEPKSKKASKKRRRRPPTEEIIDYVVEI
jgi:hypothetical protein